MSRRVDLPEPDTTGRCRTLRSLFDETVRLHGEHIARTFYRDGAWRTMTYEELKTIVASLAEALSSLGARPQKEPVLLLLDNSPTLLECSLACGTTGIVQVPVNPKLWPEDVATIAERSHACIAITSSAHLGVMAAPLFAERIVDRLDARLARNLLARLLMKCGLGWLVGRQVARSFGGRLRYIVVDDAPCSARVLETFKRLGIGIIEP